MLKIECFNMNLRRVTSLLGLLPTLLFYSVASPAAIPLDQQTQKYQFANDYLLGLDYLVRITKRSEELDELVKVDPVQADTKSMKNMHDSIKEMSYVVLRLEKHKEHGDDMMKEPVRSSIAVFQQFKTLFRQMLEQLENLHKPGADMDTLGEVQIRAAKISSDIDATYEMLMYQTVLLCHTLTSEEPSENSKLNKLDITAAEKNELINSLDLIYGPNIKDGMQAGQKHLVAAGAALRQFLEQDWVAKDGA